MKPCVRMLAAVAVVLFAFYPTALAQSNPNLEIGLKPFGAYDDTSFDSVNLGTGSLMMHIPLFEYPQRGGLKAQARLIYNNKGWQVHFDCGQKSCLAKWIYADLYPSQFLGSNALGMSLVLDPDTIPIMLGTWKGPGGTIWTFTGVTNDGASHQLAQTNVGGYESIDASGIYFNDPAGVTAFSTGNYIVLDRDGNGYNNGSAANILWQDTNGNYFSANNGQGGWTDTLGRPLYAGADDGTNTTGCTTGPPPLLPLVTYLIAGFPAPNNGTRLVKLCYVHVQLQSHFGTMVLDPVSGLEINVSEGTYTQLAVQSVIVNDGTSWASSPQWTFEYSDTDGRTDGTNYGDITQVTLPTGGSIAYTWGTRNFCVNAATAYSRGVTSRAVNPNDGTPIQVTTYSGSATNGLPVNKVTDPAGNDMVYAITGLGGSCSYYETERDYYKGSSAGPTPLLQKIVQTAYSWTTNPLDLYGDGSSTTANVVPTSVTTKYPIPNTTNYLVSQVQTDYDNSFTFYPGPLSGGTYGRITERREYDYGINNPGPLLRKTDYVYEALSGNSYLAANLLDLVAYKTVTGNIMEQTTFTYDGVALQSSGVTKQRVTTLPNPGTRGNVTLVQKWLQLHVKVSTQQTQFYDTGMPYQATDLRGNLTTYSYSPANYGANVTQTQSPNTGSPPVTHSISGGYDFNTGLLNTFTDQNLQTSSYSYDVLGRMTNASYPYGSVGFSYTDTAPWQIQKTVAVTGSLNKVTNSVFDGLGRVSETQFHDPGCQVGSQLVKVDNTYGYDTIQNTRYTTATTPYCDTIGGAFGLSTRTDSDALGRVAKVTETDGSVVTTSYAANTSGFTTTVTDEAGAARTNQSDGLGRMTVVWEDPGTSPHLNYETDYTYDTLNNLTSVSQKGDNSGTRTRSFGYDPLSRLTSASNPESGTLSYTYSNDASGCSGNPGVVCTKIAPAPNALAPSTSTVTATYTYDALNRLTKSTYSDGTTPTVSFGYDADTSTLTCSNQPSLTDSYPKGERTAMCDGSGATSWAHDKMGRVLTEKQMITGSTAITESAGYSYNLDGSIATLTYPSGRVITYSPNGSGGYTAGRPASAVETAHTINYVTNATYAPQGAIASLTNGTAIYGAFSYNTRLQPLQIYYGTNTPPDLTGSTCPGTVGNIMHRVYNFGLGVNDNGNVDIIYNCAASDRTQNFDYDSLNRIKDAYTTGTSSAAKNWGATYGIDPWGNMWSVGPYTGRVNQPPALNAPANTRNQLTGFGYDIAGNMVSNGGASYVYDAENRITNTSGTSYRYDGDGERVIKCSGTYPSCSSATLYWKGTGSDTLAEVSWTGTITSEYVFFGGQRVARRDGTGNTPHYYFSDHLGSASVVSNSTGGGLTWYDYYPYGGVAASSGSDPNNYKFTGKERDTESGLDMFGARYYGSSLGRFMTPDWEAKPTDVPYASFGNPQSLNLYSYVNNNPTTTRDPDGHCPPCGEDLIEDLALEHPEAAEAVVNAVEEVVGEGTAVAGSEGPAVAGSARWGLLAGPALFIGEMINPHTTVGGDKPPAAVPSPQMEEHTKGARPSTADDHQKGTTRKDRDARGGEKGDKAREDKGMYPRKRPSDYPKKGPWPPKPPKPPDPPPPPPKKTDDGTT